MEHQLRNLIRDTPELMETARACIEVNLPDYFIAGGSITQLIWNSLSGSAPLKNIKDFDIVYFDKSGLYNEKSFEQKIENLVTHKIKIDVVNQALVHQWYPKKFGQVISAYSKVEQGIDSWLSAFSIGFRLNQVDEITIYSPYGLADAFNKHVKPNKVTMTQENYNKLVASYYKRWPEITVEQWD